MVEALKCVEPARSNAWTVWQQKFAETDHGAKDGPEFVVRAAEAYRALSSAERRRLQEEANLPYHAIVEASDSVEDMHAARYVIT